jgi:hypothetical protein
MIKIFQNLIFNNQGQIFQWSSILLTNVSINKPNNKIYALIIPKVKITI